MGHLTTAAPPSSMNPVCCFTVHLFLAFAHFHPCFPRSFFQPFLCSFHSLIFVSESISSTAPPNVTVHLPTAQDFGGGEFWGFYLSFPVILIPIKWEIFIFETDLQACLPPLPWLLQVSLIPHGFALSR